MTLKNFTIITTGGCNASCDFCSDPMNVKPAPDYMIKLEDTIQSLPSGWNQVSISGGEPTISPHFLKVLDLVSEYDFDKVVLTTNGTNLIKYLKQIGDTVNHLNISRHAVGYEANVAIFKNKQIIKDQDIKEAAYYLATRGVDVTLNYVYTKANMPTAMQALQFISYARSLGAGVCFRYDQRENDMSLTEFEQEFLDMGYRIVMEGGCPVCRSHSLLICGSLVTFRGGIQEPSDIGEAGTNDDPYELIFHPTGKVTRDWGAKLPWRPKPSKKCQASAKEVRAALKPKRRPATASSHNDSISGRSENRCGGSNRCGSSRSSNRCGSPSSRC